jgi:hypothetical protein
LRDVQLSGESKGTSYADLLMNETIRASIQSGRVETVCAAPTNSGAERWALNVKKAILSAFQLPLKTLDSNQVVTIHEVSYAAGWASMFRGLHTIKSSGVIYVWNIFSPKIVKSAVELSIFYCCIVISHKVRSKCAIYGIQSSNMDLWP